MSCLYCVIHSLSIGIVFFCPLLLFFFLKITHGVNHSHCCWWWFFVLWEGRVPRISFLAPVLWVSIFYHYLWCAGLDRLTVSETCCPCPPPTLVWLFSCIFLLCPWSIPFIPNTQQFGFKLRIYPVISALWRWCCVFECRNIYLFI